MLEENTHGNSTSPAKRAKATTKRQGISPNSVRWNIVITSPNTNAVECFVKETDGSVPNIGTRRRSGSARLALLVSHVGMKSVRVDTEQWAPMDMTSILSDPLGETRGEPHLPHLSMCGTKNVTKGYLQSIRSPQVCVSGW